MAHKTLAGRTCKVTASASKCIFHRGKKTSRKRRKRFSATSKRRGSYRGAKRGYRY